MMRYLIFPEEQQKRSPNPLEDYELAGTKLLPVNFGTIASANIFLGENNSGKSRFMREIMRDKGLQIIDIQSIASNLINQIGRIAELIEQTEHFSDIKIIVNVRGGNIDKNEHNTRIINMLWGEVRSGSSLNNVVINIKEIIDNLSKIIEKLKDYNLTIEDSVQLLSKSTGLEMIEQLKRAEEEISKLDNIFNGLQNAGILGKNFNPNFSSTGFQLGFADIKFDKWPFSIAGYNGGYHYDVKEKEIYLQSAAFISGAIVLAIRNARQMVEQVLNNIIGLEHRTYIPTLRTARTLITQDGSRLESTNDIFLHTTTHDYSLADTGVIVDTGFSLYDAIDTTRNARHGGRTSFKAFEEFLSTTFFNGKTVEVVAERVRNERGGNIIVAVEGVERDIHDLGDGIQAIIMLLYPLFIAPERAWFFIEEPEVHLHPGFQRLFIETVTSNKVLRDKHLTIFLTTHSNHILDFALDDPSHVNIFTFRRREGVGNKSTYQIQLSSQRDIENLNVLGVRNSSVFLANCSIWVEGISDRLYFRAYLQAYLAYLAEREKDPKTVSLLEGLHYTFLEYAGGNISHFDFTTQQGAFTTQTIENIKSLSISNRIMLVADLDDGKKTRHEARTDQEHTGFKYVVLTVKEVENMLSPELLARGLKKLFQSRNFDPHILTQAEYRTRYLGTYLQEKYPGFPTSFIAGSGTIGSNYKRPLAEAVAANLKWEEMSPAAQKFTETIYQFIMDHNPRLGSN